MWPAGEWAPEHVMHICFCGRRPSQQACAGRYLLACLLYVSSLLHEALLQCQPPCSSRAWNSHQAICSAAAVQHVQACSCSLRSPCEDAAFDAAACPCRAAVPAARSSGATMQSCRPAAAHGMCAFFARLPMCCAAAVRMHGTTPTAQPQFHWRPPILAASAPAPHHRGEREPSNTCLQEHFMALEHPNAFTDLG